VATPRQFRRRGRYTLVALALVGTLIAAAVALGAVTTDQSAYLPGSTVHITGDGMAADAAVAITIDRPDGVTDTGETTADADGTFTYAYALPGEDSPVYGTYFVTATDGTNTYTTTFTDDQPAFVNFFASGLPSGTSLTVNVSYTNPGGHLQDVHDTSFTTPNHGHMATDANTSLSFTYPATVGGCTLTGSDATSPITTGASGSDTDITGTYSCANNPTAEANGPSSGDEGSSIALSSAGSHANGSGVTITGYLWSIDTTGIDAGGTCDFVSPSTSTSASPNISCTDDSDGGTFSVSLTVTDSNGHTASDSATLTVNNVKPTVTFGTGLDTSVNEHPTTTHHYTYTISDPGSNDTVVADSITPTCGGADGATVSNATNTSTGGSFDCLFPDGEVPANTSTLSVQATDDDGAASDAATLDVTVNNVNPTVAAFAPSGTGCSVSVSSISFTDPGQAYDNNYTGSIDWGDSGTTSLGSTTYSTPSFTGPFTHTYSVAGSYTITASVTDDDTGLGTKTASFDNTPTIGWPNAPLVLGNGNTKSFNTGSAIPIKIKVTGCAAGLAPTISITPVAGTIQSKGSSNTQDQMRYDASLPGFIYNWNTKGWAVGSYTVTVNMPPLGTFSVPNVSLVK